MVTKLKNTDGLSFAITIVLVLWGVFVLSAILPLTKWGIIPRSPSGLIGILASPFLHANWQHLAANSSSIFILSIVLFMFARERVILVMVLLVVFSGVGTWLIGRPGSIHIGASGLIYGIMGYLMSVGFFQRKFKAMIISIFIFVFYGGAIWGVLPSQPYISWEGHLSGFISGIILAKYKV